MVENKMSDIYDEVYQDLQKRFPDGLPEDEYIQVLLSIEMKHESGPLVVAAIATFTGKDWQEVQFDLEDNIDWTSPERLRLIALSVAGNNCQL